MVLVDLRQAREELNLTQKGMAETLGIGLTTWKNYESAKRKPPKEIVEKVECLLRDYQESRDHEIDTGITYSEEDIKEYLLNALDEKGAFKPVFVDLVNRYMQMWKTSLELERDIEEKGVSVEGQTGPKKNDSVALLVNVNKQMLIILDKLGLNANTIKPEDGADV